MLSITFYCLTSPLTVLFYIVIAITELHASSFLWRYMSTGAIISTLSIHCLCEQSCNAFLWCRVAFWARGVSNSTLLIYIKLRAWLHCAHQGATWCIWKLKEKFWIYFCQPKMKKDSSSRSQPCVCTVMGGRRRGTAPVCCFPLSIY